MKKIDAYKTFDGKLFEYEENAIIHEKTYDLNATLNKYCADCLAGGTSLNNSDVSRFIFDNRVKFFEILKNFFEEDKKETTKIKLVLNFPSKTNKLENDEVDLDIELDVNEEQFENIKTICQDSSNFLKFIKL